MSSLAIRSLPLMGMGAVASKRAFSTLANSNRVQFHSGDVLRCRLQKHSVGEDPSFAEMINLATDRFANTNVKEEAVKPILTGLLKHKKIPETEIAQKADRLKGALLDCAFRKIPV